MSKIYESFLQEHILKNDPLLKTVVGSPEYSQFDSLSKQKLFLISTKLKKQANIVLFSKNIIKQGLLFAKNKLEKNIPLLKLLQCDKINAELEDNELLALLNNLEYNDKVKPDSIQTTVGLNVINNLLGCSFSNALSQLSLDKNDAAILLEHTKKQETLDETSENELTSEFITNIKESLFEKNDTAPEILSDEAMDLNESSNEINDQEENINNLDDTNQDEKIDETDDRAEETISDQDESNKQDEEENKSTSDESENNDEVFVNSPPRVTIYEVFSEPKMQKNVDKKSSTPITSPSVKDDNAVNDSPTIQNEKEETATQSKFSQQIPEIKPLKPFKSNNITIPDDKIINTNIQNTAEVTDEMDVDVESKNLLNLLSKRKASNNNIDTLVDSVLNSETPEKVDDFDFKKPKTFDKFLDYYTSGKVKAPEPSVAEDEPVKKRRRKFQSVFNFSK